MGVLDELPAEPAHELTWPSPCASLVNVTRWRIVLLGLMAAPLVLFGLSSAAWAIDNRGADDTVARGTVLAGQDVGGQSRVQLEKTVIDLSAQIPRMPITISTGSQEMTTTAAELGVSVDAAGTVSRAMAVGRTDPWPLPPVRWVKALVTDRPIPLSLTIDRATATDTLRRLEGDGRTEALEPTATASADGLTLVPGVTGREIDVDKVLAQLPLGLETVDGAIRIDTEPATRAPTVSDADVQGVIDRANSNTAGEIEVEVGDSTQTYDARRVRPFLGVTVTGGTPSVTVDDDKLLADLRVAVSTPPNPTDVRFTIGYGTAVPQAGHDAVVCCAAGAPRELLDALLSAQPSVKLDTTTVTAAEGLEWARTLGVKEPIGTFTTKHPAGQPRVKNIHRISDLTAGVLIAPGATYSVNDFVGRRTAEKGFVSAPVIEEGKFSEDVGGGVSQYATTLFNAAFFGGLDIPDHKAHSIYISRYPFGREATLAYPSVDLKIHNDTPYGVVVWPSYTDTSITIDLWSTRYAVGAQTAQNKTSGCGFVKVTRTRTYVSDGHQSTDNFQASYNCNPPKH